MLRKTMLAALAAAFGVGALPAANAQTEIQWWH